MAQKSKPMPRADLYPCWECEKKKDCGNMQCEMWREWYDVAWQEVTDKLKQIKGRD